MIALLFTACLAAAPERCQDLRLDIAAAELAPKCPAEAEEIVAIWAEDHPCLRVTEWRCADASRKGA